MAGLLRKVLMTKLLMLKVLILVTKLWLLLLEADLRLIRNLDC